VDVALLVDADLPWMHYLFAKKYPSHYDAITSENWFRNTVLPNPQLFYPARTRRAFAISMLNIMPWIPNEIECNIVAVCADDDAVWEVICLFRASIKWAKSRKCQMWRLCSETDKELAAIATRVGATEVWPRYVMRL
jgi:hypothetical protein